MRSPGEIAAHMVMACVWYLHGVMGEGGPDVAPLMYWDEPGAPLRSVAAPNCWRVST